MDIRKILDKYPHILTRHTRELEKFTTSNGERIKFSVTKGDLPPKMYLIFRISRTEDANEIDKAIVVAYPHESSAGFNNGTPYGEIKEVYLNQIFDPIKEAVFYNKIDQEISEFELRRGVKNFLGLSLDERGEILFEGNKDFLRDLVKRVAFEICHCLELKNNYLEGISQHELVKELWFSRKLVNKVLTSKAIKESSFWQIENGIVALNDPGRDFLKNYKSPLEEPQPVEESKIEEIRASNISVPEFAFINDSKIKDILKRDWIEIQRSLLVDNWKSAIILCGGVLEALLLDSLRSREKEARNAKTRLLQQDHSISKGSSVGSWDLYTLIQVASELKLITKSGQKIGDVLRDFRNLIHPQKEAKGDYRVRDFEAIASFNLLQGITKDLEEKLDQIKEHTGSKIDAKSLVKLLREERETH